MEAIKLKARIKGSAILEWLEPLPELPEGEVEVILLYKGDGGLEKKISPSDWPVLHGGRYLLNDHLSRNQIYEDNGR